MLMIIVVIVFVLFRGNCENWYGYERKPVIKTKQGLIEGVKVYKSERVSNGVVHGFLGIPYATPPVGPLRFMPPIKHSGWNGTYQAAEYGPSCPQLPQLQGNHTTYNEDCLFLNIWTPENAIYNGPLPVLVFLEGYEFSHSMSLSLSGADLSAAEDLVVVSLNYRLNVFGFFTLGTRRSRGNLGLLDQYLAMLWIRDNILQFGGDPNKITLYGHCSGGVSVLMHVISPRTPDLFQRVIISSGSIFAPWQLSNDPIKASRDIIRILGCDSYTYTADPLVCLQSKKVEHILQALEEHSGSFSKLDKFGPVIDSFLPTSDRYLPNTPEKAFKDRTVLQVPILTGISRTIADPQFVDWIDLASKGHNQLQQYIEKAKIPEIMRLYRFGTTNNGMIFDLIKWKYSSSSGDVRTLFEQLKNIEFESKIQAPQFLQLSKLASSATQPIYSYFMDDINIIINTTDPIVSTDLLLLFGPMLMNQVGRKKFNSYELQLSNQVKQMWGNFVKFGNPTPNNYNVQWRKYTNADPYIEDFGISKGRYNNEDQHTRMKTIQFWNTLLPQIASSKTNLSNIPRELQNSPDPAAGFRHALYTVIALAIALLALLVVCIFLLKKKSKERESQFHMGY